MKEKLWRLFLGYHREFQKRVPSRAGLRDAIGLSGRVKSCPTLVDEDWLRMAYDHCVSADACNLDLEVATGCAIMEALRGGAHAELQVMNEMLVRCIWSKSWVDLTNSASLAVYGNITWICAWFADWIWFTSERIFQSWWTRKLFSKRRRYLN